MKSNLANVRSASSGITPINRTKRFGNLWQMTAVGLLCDVDRTFLANGATVLVSGAGELLLHPQGFPGLPADASIVAQVDTQTDPIWLAQKLKAAVEARLICSGVGAVA